MLEEHDLGEVTGEAGYYPEDDRHTLLGQAIQERLLDDVWH